MVLSADEHHKCLQSLLTRANFVVPQLIISQIGMILDRTRREQQRRLLQKRAHLYWHAVVANRLDDDDDDDADEGNDVRQSLDFVNHNRS